MSIYYAVRLDQGLNKPYGNKLENANNFMG
jgi:hypothetical protein